ncbi:MAG: MarR family winged helix-turn-helix transcriptional regulator [Pseudomonadota bacterium]
MKKSLLREQAKQIAKDCIAVRIRLLNRIVTNIYDTAMRPYGISLNQASILTIITVNDGAGYGDICKILYMEKSTVSRTIERMKKNGWIETMSGKDNGVTVVNITLAGERILEKAYLAWAQAQEEATRCLGQEGVAASMKVAESFWPMGKIQEG